MHQAKDQKGKYSLYKRLFDDYKTFSYDSAYSYSRKMLVAATRLNDQLKIANAKMDLGFVLISSRVFKENTGKIEYYLDLS